MFEDWHGLGISIYGTPKASFSVDDISMASHFLGDNMFQALSYLPVISVLIYPSALVNPVKTNPNMISLYILKMSHIDIPLFQMKFIICLTDITIGNLKSRRTASCLSIIH